MKIQNIYHHLIIESKKDWMSELEIDGDDAILYHYSDSPHHLLINTGGTRKTSAESRAMGGIWFYCHKDGVSYDTGVSNEYLHIVKIPVNEIYNYITNPEHLSKESFFKTKSQMLKLGYTAWLAVIYGTVPIVNGFKGEYKPIQVLKKTNNGYEEIDLSDKYKEDPIVGKVKINNGMFDVYADLTTQPSEESFYYKDIIGNKKEPVTVDMIDNRDSTFIPGAGGGEYSKLFSAIKYHLGPYKKPYKQY